MVPDERFGQAILLRDTEGVTAKVATIPSPLWPILARFTGAHTTLDIAATVSRESGETVPVELVERLAEQLDEALFLDTPRYRAERARVEQEFLLSPVRPATHDTPIAPHGGPNIA